SSWESEIPNSPGPKLRLSDSLLVASLKSINCWASAKTASRSKSTRPFFNRYSRDSISEDYQWPANSETRSCLLDTPAWVRMTALDRSSGPTQQEASCAAIASLFRWSFWFWHRFVPYLHRILSIPHPPCTGARSAPLVPAAPERFPVLPVNPTFSISDSIMEDYGVRPTLAPTGNRFLTMKRQDQLAPSR